MQVIAVLLRTPVLHNRPRILYPPSQGFKVTPVSRYIWLKGPVSINSAVEHAGREKKAQSHHPARSCPSFQPESNGQKSTQWNSTQIPEKVTQQRWRHFTHLNAWSANQLLLKLSVMASSIRASWHVASHFASSQISFSWVILCSLIVLMPDVLAQCVILVLFSSLSSGSFEGWLQSVTAQTLTTATSLNVSSRAGTLSCQVMTQTSRLGKFMWRK